MPEGFAFFGVRCLEVSHPAESLGRWSLEPNRSACSIAVHGSPTVIPGDRDTQQGSGTPLVVSRVSGQASSRSGRLGSVLTIPPTVGASSSMRWPWMTAPPRACHGATPPLEFPPPSCFDPMRPSRGLRVTSRLFVIGVSRAPLESSRKGRNGAIFTSDSQLAHTGRHGSGPSVGPRRNPEGNPNER